MLAVKADWQGHEVLVTLCLQLGSIELDSQAWPTFSVLNLGPPTVMVSLWFLLKPLCKCLYQYSV